MFLLLSLFCVPLFGQDFPAERLRLGGEEAFSAAAQAAAEKLKYPIIQPGKPRSRLVSGAPGPLLATLDLKTLHNGLWRTSLGVRLGGRDFLISAQESAAGGCYVTLLDAAGGNVRFFECYKLALWGGYVELIGGVSYRFKISPYLWNRYESKFQVKEESGKIVGEVRVREIMAAMYQAGRPARWADKEFRVHYTDQLFTEGGGALRVEKPLLVLMKEQPDKSGDERYAGDAVAAEDIPDSAAGPVFLEAHFRIAPYGGFAYWLRRTSSGKTLEIYSAPDPAAPDGRD